MQQNGARIAILSSPRSGNTWVRHMLMQCYSAQALAVHDPADIPWENLPPSVVLQLHWHRTVELTTLLNRYGFRPITLARHPLDLLISVLQFAMHEPTTASWLLGEGGSERALQGTTPNSAAFSEYAVGARAKALLSVSAEWWQAENAIRVKYEDLVTDTHKALASLIKAIGQPSQDDLDAAIQANTLEKQRLHSTNNHFWQGQPGLWRNLLTSSTAMRIFAAHTQTFLSLGYFCNPDLNLTTEQADRLWHSLL